MKLRIFAVVAAVLALASSSMVLGQSVVNPGNYNFSPAEKQAYDLQVGPYAIAINAINAVFGYPRNYALWTESRSGKAPNIRFTFTVAPVVHRLWDVDAPVQAFEACKTYPDFPPPGILSKNDCRRTMLINYLRMTNHPRNGNVNMWYRVTYKL